MSWTLFWLMAYISEDRVVTKATSRQQLHVLQGLAKGVFYEARSLHSTRLNLAKVQAIWFDTRNNINGDLEVCQQRTAASALDNHPNVGDKTDVECLNVHLIKVQNMLFLRYRIQEVGNFPYHHAHIYIHFTPRMKPAQTETLFTRFVRFVTSLWPR